MTKPPRLAAVLFAAGGFVLLRLPVVIRGALLVAGLLRALLGDLGASAPWAAAGAVLWLAQPLGTEAALWPAALHVPLGLALALAALRLHRNGNYVWGSLAVVGAF